MLDPYVRPLIDPPLNYVGKRVAAWGISANAVTIAGFIFGLFAILMIGIEQYFFGAIMLCINRKLDGIDGAVARHTQLTDFGGFLDIVCDFIIYSGIVFAFGIGNPTQLFYAAFLIFSFIGTITSFLAYAIIAAKKQIVSNRRGTKSFYHLGGICEGTETTFVLILMCLIPHSFHIICLIYGGLCWLTTIGRVYRAWSDFGSHSLPSANDDSYKNVCTKQAIETESPTP